MSWFMSRLLASMRCLKKSTTGSNKANPNRTVKAVQNHLTMVYLVVMPWWAVWETPQSWTLSRNLLNVIFSTLTEEITIQLMIRFLWVRWFMKNKSTIWRLFKSFVPNSSTYSTHFKPQIWFGKWSIIFPLFLRKTSMRQTNWWSASTSLILISFLLLALTKYMMPSSTPSSTFSPTNHLLRLFLRCVLVY